MQPWFGISLGLVIAFPMILGVSPASAIECLQPPQRDDAKAREMADANFVGRVESVSEHNRVAIVVVEEVRKGPRQPDRIEVQGFVDGTYTSGDRGFEVGQRYVFSFRANRTRLGGRPAI